jgi:hypothetical protein
LNDPYFLIEQTFQEINEGWVPGTLEWIKQNNPERWREVVKLERDITQMAVNGDKTGSTKVLEAYKTFYREAIKMFRAPKGETGDLFHMNKVGSNYAASFGRY